MGLIGKPRPPYQAADDQADPLVSALFRERSILREVRADDGRCLIARFDGAILSQKWREALWDKFVTGAPRPRTLSEQLYRDRSPSARRGAVQWLKFALIDRRKCDV